MSFMSKEHISHFPRKNRKCYFATLFSIRPASKWLFILPMKFAKNEEALVSFGDWDGERREKAKEERREKANSPELDSRLKEVSPRSHSEEKESEGKRAHRGTTKLQAMQKFTVRATTELTTLALVIQLFDMSCGGFHELSRFRSEASRIEAILATASASLHPSTSFPAKIASPLLGSLLALALPEKQKTNWDAKSRRYKFASRSGKQGSCKLSLTVQYSNSSTTRG